MLCIDLADLMNTALQSFSDIVVEQCLPDLHCTSKSLRFHRVLEEIFHYVLKIGVTVDHEIDMLPEVTKESSWVAFR